MIDVDIIKKLRVETGSGILEIKQALEEAKGDLKKAKELLKAQGLVKAGKKEGRETKAGVVEAYIHTAKTSGAIIVLTCETDFVARNEEFGKLAHEIAMQVCAMDPKNLAGLLVEPWIRDEKKTIKNLISEHIAKFGENIKVEDFKRFKIGHGFK